MVNILCKPVVFLHMFHIKVKTYTGKHFFLKIPINEQNDAKLESASPSRTQKASCSERLKTLCFYIYKAIL